MSTNSLGSEFVQVPYYKIHANTFQSTSHLIENINDMLLNIIYPHSLIYLIIPNY